MTNEEAIKELQSMCDHLHAHGICDKDSNMLTACKMAISALEQMPEVTSTMQTGQFDYVRQPYEDAVSRIFKRMWNCRGKHTTSIDKVKMEQIIRDELPSVTRQTGKWIDGVHAMGYREGYKDAQKQKTGRWIFDEILDKHYYCSECKSMGVNYWDFCPNCGAKMIGPQESEVRNDNNQNV